MSATLLQYKAVESDRAAKSVPATGSFRVARDVLALRVLDKVNPQRAAHWLHDRFWVRPIRPPVAARSRDVLARARRAVVARGDMECPVYVWGDEGPTVLLVHGWSGRASQMTAFVDPLVDAGLRVVAFDGFAHGDSAGTTTDLPEYSRVIATVGHALGNCTGIVSHSAGATATVLALRRGGLVVPRLALLSPYADLEAQLQSAHRRLGIGDKTKSIHRNMLFQIYGDGVFQTYSPLSTPSDAPTRVLVVHDNDDREVPISDGERVAASWPDARLLATNGLGHYRVLWSPDVTKAVAEFLRGNN